MKVTITDVVLTRREVDIPNTCPKCGMDFREATGGEGDLLVQNLITDWKNAWVGSDPDEPLKYNERDNFDGGTDEVVGLVRFQCRACNLVLVQGREKAYDELAQTVEDVCEVLWPAGDAEHTWDAETIELVARVLHDAGFGPEKEKKS